MCIGMSQSETDETGWRGTNEGSKLKATSGWYSGGNGTYESCFSALPGGYHDLVYGTFNGVGFYGHWWSATDDFIGYVWRRELNDYHSDVGRNYFDKRLGFSVRLVSD
jgi:uncharacterized protein (TIGR02145 family)